MPIAAIYAGLLTVMFLVLANRVSTLRRSERVGIGDGDNVTLRHAIRVHANFAEAVPMGLLAMGLAESVGAPAFALHAIGVATVVGRILHAYGLSQSAKRTVGRFWGLALHWTSMAVSAVLAVGYGVVAIVA